MTGAINPATNIPDGDAAGLEFQQTGPGAWRIVHTASGLHLPMVGWPTNDLPRCYASTAMAHLATSGIDWTQSRDQIWADIKPVADAVRTAALAARDLALVDGHPAVLTHDDEDDWRQQYIDRLAGVKTDPHQTAPLAT